MTRTVRFAGLALGVLLVAAACSSSSTPAPSTGPGGPAGSVVAVVPADQLQRPTKLVACSDLPYPPQEFFDAQGNPTGSDIELGQGIAQRLGLTLDVQNTVFDTIIAALLAGKCDIIISAQNITSDRIKQVDMIPYFQAGQSFVVDKGNPKGIKTVTDLCGKKVAVEANTTEDNNLNGTGDYKGTGLSETQCVAKGQPPITSVSFAHDNDALLALQTGKADAYFTDSPVAGYYTVQSPDKFELSGVTVGVALEGISTPNDAAHKALETGVQKALVSMINDGSYAAVLKKYGVESGAVTAADAGQINKLQ